MLTTRVCWGRGLRADIKSAFEPSTPPCYLSILLSYFVHPFHEKMSLLSFLGVPDYSSGGDCAFYKNNLNSSSEWVEVRGRERHHHCTEAVGCITAKTTKSKLASTVWVSTVLSTRHWDQQKEENTQCFFSSDKQCRNALPVVLALQLNLLKILGAKMTCAVWERSQRTGIRCCPVTQNFA